MIGALLPDIWPYLAGLVAIIGAALGLYAKGRADVKTKTALQEAERYAKTRKEMDDAQVVSDDPAVLREWLRERGKQPGDL
jgi:hypothetical protein